MEATPEESAAWEPQRRALAEVARRVAERVGGDASRAPRDAIPVHGLRGAARAAFIAALYRERPRPVLVLLPDPRDAEDLALDLCFFLGEAPGGEALRKRVHVLPAWDVAPFAPLSPSAETIAQRIEGLYHLAQTPNPILVATPEALLQRAMSPAALRESTAYLVEGEEVDLAELSARLVDWGYRRRPLVEDRGELAVRGGLLDVFVTGLADPLRLELAGDTVESIRSFDPRTQRRVASHEDALILPAAEFPLRARRDPERLRRIDERAREIEMERRERLQLLEAIGDGVSVPGLEALAPYLVEMGSVTEHVPVDAVVVLEDPVLFRQKLDDAWESVASHAEIAAEERRAHAPREDLYLSPDVLLERLTRWPRVALAPLVRADAIEGVTNGAEVVSDRSTPTAERVDARVPFEIRATRLLRDERGFGNLDERIRAWTGAGARIALVVGSAAQAERLRHILEGRGIDAPAVGESYPEALAARSAPGPFIVQGELSGSIELPSDDAVCIAELNLFGEHRRARRRPAVALSLDQVMKSLEQLKPDDFVVHIDHGIGLYRGLKHLTVAGSEGDFLHLEYLGGDRLYLPVTFVNLVQKYVGGDGAEPALDKLGGTTWERVKKKAKESILAMAHELLSLYATRARHEGHAFSTSDPYYQEFEARFPFEETPDQQRAIDEVLGDLGKTKPMDRLVCGDVGYGKTEVAMRAAFICAMEGQQVAILVPTTVLAQQHLDTFQRRLVGYPVRIEMLSSFQTKKENAETIARLATGQTDIVVGTHRLLQSDVQFARLGLLVVDEEHRFGVKDKERIKSLRKLVDVLTLTATPIPRTLELSLSGIRDLSVIETPPLDRQAIRTYVTRFDDHVIREAMLRELNRGGQAFFVHNRVESIDRIGQRLRAIVPEARIEVAHGQMRAHALEKTMLRFLRREFDMLLCTTIIESGLDIPNANTMFIDRADTLGLAQLYQLRGRVGRSPARAYAYLLIPGEHILSKEARMRLQVLQELDDLGGGFKIAAHDLEIRGAGNLLGKQQSGHITAVGFELYTKMMEEAVHELRGEPVATEIEPEIQLGMSAYIPESYVDDVNQRLVLYKRLAALREPDEVHALADELRDRYGPLPALAEALLEMMDLRRRMKAIGVSEARVRGKRLALRFHASSRISTERLIDLVTSSAPSVKLAPLDGSVRMVGAVAKKKPIPPPAPAVAPPRYLIAPDGTFSIAAESDVSGQLAELHAAIELLEGMMPADENAA